MIKTVLRFAICFGIGWTIGKSATKNQNSKNKHKCQHCNGKCINCPKCNSSCKHYSDCFSTEFDNDEIFNEEDEEEPYDYNIEDWDLK